MELEGGVQRHNERAKEAKILMRNNRQDQATFSLSATVGGNLQLLGEKNVIASFICQGQIQYRSYFWIWATVSTRVWLSVLSEGKDQWFLSLLMDILSSDPLWVKESCSIFHQFHRSKCFSTHNLILMPHTWVVGTVKVTIQVRVAGTFYKTEQRQNGCRRSDMFDRRRTGVGTYACLCGNSNDELREKGLRDP